MQQDKDRSSKWLLANYGDTILKLAGIRGFSSWRHVPSELVAPRRLLDGLLEIRYPNEAQPRKVLVEIESFASNDADRQVFENITLVNLVHDEVPEVVSLILRPKGNAQVTGQRDVTSRSGQVQLRAQWPVVRLWEQDAEALFAENDVSFIPWIPLAHSDRPIEEIATRCVAKLELVQDRSTRSALFAVTRIFAGFAHPEQRAVLANIFGGLKAMTLSPVLEEVREYLRTVYLAEGMNEGRQQGLQQGIQEGLQQGIQEGLQQGIQEGLQQGIQEGLQQGIQEGLQQGIQEGLQQGIQEGLQQGIQEGLQQGIQQGRAEGQLASRREDLCDALEARFGPLDPALVQQILMLTDLAKLKELLRVAIACSELAAFAQNLKEGPS